jgi:hypothetical protein
VCQLHSNKSIKSNHYGNGQCSSPAIKKVYESFPCVSAVSELWGVFALKLSNTKPCMNLMFSNTYEAAAAVEQAALGGDEKNPHSVLDPRSSHGPSGKGGRALQAANPSLPSPAVASTQKADRKARRRRGRGHTPNQGAKSPQQPSGNGIGSPKDGQARQIAKDLNVYKYTKLYNEAVHKGFKTDAALQKFNAWVTDHIDDIDPREQVACNKCGGVDYLLCKCFITCEPTSVDIVDDAIVIPAGRNIIDIKYTWFGQLWRRVIRGYDKSQLDYTVVNNHNINEVATLLKKPKLQKQVDENIIVPLYNYLRVNQHTSYDLSGVDNRAARLAHCHKLALRWVTLNKLDDNLSETLFVNQMMITVQRAADQVENRTIYGAIDPNIRKPGLFTKIKDRLLYGKSLDD